MSVFSKIKADFILVESSASKFEKAFVKIFKKAPAAIQVVDNFISEVAPVVIAADALLAPETEPEVAAAFAIVETGLAAIEASAQAANSGQSLLVNLQNLATTVPSVLNGLAIKNPLLKAAIERIVTLVVSEAKVLIPAIEGWVKQIEAANVAPAK